MKQLRSIGAFSIVCAVICGLVAFERYSTARRTAMAIAETLEGVDFVAVGIPLTTKIGAFLGAVLLVAGLRCVFESYRDANEI